jgi:hypothetical protein
MSLYSLFSVVWWHYWLLGFLVSDYLGNDILPFGRWSSWEGIEGRFFKCNVGALERMVLYIH